MTPGWQRVRDLFEEVCDLPEPQRGAVLSRRCAGQPQLLAEVESLLTSSAQAPEFLEASVLGCLQTFHAPAAQPLIGCRIGDYRIVQAIASGGMGSVYLASRSDGQFDRRVAVKIIKQELISDDRLRRFSRERHTLARLDHPYIARLIDGGVTSGGLQYLIMEYVDGQAVDRYCDQRCLSTAARLNLFCRVCEAVAQAHRQLIVHRDIKPSNILVTADGTPKLLDFGISKVLDPHDEAPQAGHTATAARYMTVGYASPEQVRGEPVTTVSDVYSLGVVLYELLAGRRPHEEHGQSLLAAQQAVCEKEPERPSAAVLRRSAALSGNSLDETPEAISRSRGTEPERLARTLSGDLDAIVLMAMRPEPQRRYSSVERLVADIQCHLRGWPVQARSGTRRYRAGKFLRRHATAVVVSGALALSIAAGLVGTLWQARLAAAERDAALLARAESLAQARKAERVVGFLEDMLAGPDARNQGRELKVVEVLGQAAGQIDQDPELAEHPLVQAGIHMVIGTTYHSLGDYAGAELQLRTALQLRREHLAPDDADLVESMIELGSLLTSLGRYPEADALLREAVELERRRAQPHPAQLALALSRLGKLVQLRGDLEAAEALRREELDIRRQLYPGAHLEVASSLNNLATVLQMQSRNDAAEPLYLEALNMYRVLLDPDHSDVSDILHNLGSLKKTQGDLQQAETLLREALRIRRTALGPDHANVARTLSNLGAVLAQNGALVEAEGMHRESLAIRRLRLGDAHPDTGRSLHRLAEVLLLEDRAPEAQPLLEQAVATITAALPPAHRDVVSARCAQADCLRRLGRYEEAERELLDYHDQLTGLEQPDARSVDAVVRRLVELYLDWERPDQVRQWQDARPLVEERAAGR